MEPITSGTDGHNTNRAEPRRSLICNSTDHLVMYHFVPYSVKLDLKTDSIVRTVTLHVERGYGCAVVAEDRAKQDGTLRASAVQGAAAALRCRE